MVDKKVSELDAIGAATTDDLLYLVDGTTVSKKITFDALQKSVDHTTITNIGTKSHTVLESDITSLSGAYISHAADASDPHGATLTQTNLNATELSGARISVTADYETLSGAYVCNVIYGTGTTPPTANTFTRGSVYLQYTP